MPLIHVHVPYSRFHETVPVLRENRLSVELYLDGDSLDAITEADLHGVRDALDWEHTLSVHGPFMDLCPGAVDSKVAAATLDRFLQLMGLLRILRPEVVVFHSGYEKWKYGGDVGLWLEPSIRTWRKVMEEAEKTGIKVAIENIVDAEPDNLRLLADRMDHPLFGLCLDVGHREIFSTLPVAGWVEKFHPHIFEFHLHDNNGTADDHLPIGSGRVDFASLFSKVRELGIDPVHTLEAHSASDALVSLSNLEGFIRRG